MAKPGKSLMREITMRRIGLAFIVLAAVPAALLPLLACVVMMSAPAALIAGIAGLSTPSHVAHDSVTPANAATTSMIARR